VRLSPDKRPWSVEAEVRVFSDRIGGWGFAADFFACPEGVGAAFARTPPIEDAALTTKNEKLENSNS
jgi:hypothetical protein